MTQLRATAVISAVDRASAVFARVAANAHALGGRVRTAGAAIGAFGQTATLGLLGAGVGLGGFGFAAQYNVSKLRTAIRSAGELTSEEMQGINRAAEQAGLQYGHTLGQMLEGTKELVQGGLNAKVLADGLDVLGKSARVNQMPLGTMAEKLIQTSRALGYSMDTGEEVRSALTKSSDLLSVAPNISTDSTEGFFTFLKYYGPIAKVIGQSEAEIAALGATMADLGFKGEEGGAAMRTIMARMVTMTPKARAAFKAEGGKLDGLFDIDQTKLGDMGSLDQRMQGLFGRKVGGLGKFSDPSRFGDVSEWRDALTKHVISSLGIGKGQAQERKEITAAVEQHISRAITKIDVERMFSELERLQTSLATDSELFGKQRLQQGAGLKKAVELYKKKLAEAQAKLDGATERRLLYTIGTLDTEMDRLAAAWSVFRDRMFRSGSESVMTRTISSLSGALADLSQADPSVLNGVVAGVAALVAVPAGVWAVTTIGSGFATLAAGIGAAGAELAGAPLLAKLLLGGGLLALADLGTAFQLGSPVGDLGPVIPTSSIGETLEALGGVFKELGGALGDVTTAAGTVSSEVQKLFGLDGKDSVLVLSLKAIKVYLDAMASAIKMTRESVPRVLGYAEDLAAGTVDKPASDSTMFGWGVGDDRTVGPPTGPLMKDIDPTAGATPIAVQGQANVAVEGQVQGRVEIDIKVDGPGSVTDRRGGDLSGKLDRGTSTMDIEGGGAP